MSGPLTEPPTRAAKERLRHLGALRGLLMYSAPLADRRLGGDPSIGEGTFAAIFWHTGGMPRKINILCKRPLLLGLMDGRHAIGGKDVAEVIEDLEQEFAPATYLACEMGNKAPV